MKIKNNRYVIWGICSLMMLGSCKSPDNSEEVQKILDKQVEVLNKEQETAEGLYNRVKDSLEKQESILLEKKKDVEMKISDFEQTKKLEKIAELKDEKDELQSELQAIEDSVAMLKNELAKLENKRSELELKGDLLKEQKQLAEDSLLTGIEEVDQRLDKVESQKITKQQEININKQKIDLASQKISLLEEEKNIYVREKNDLVLQNDQSEEIKKFDAKISEVEAELKNENEKIAQASKIVSANKQWLEDFSSLKSSLKTVMAQEFNRKQTIDSFTLNETKRLNKELIQIQEEKKELETTQTKLNKQKKGINQNLASIDNEIAVVSNSDLAELLQRKSDLDMAEAILSAQESKLTKTIDTMDEVSSEPASQENLSLLDALEDDLKQQRAEIQNIKHEIASERIELAQKQADINAKRAKNAEAFRYIGFIIAAGILALLALFYLGRKKRLNKAQ